MILKPLASVEGRSRLRANISRRPSTLAFPAPVLFPGARLRDGPPPPSAAIPNFMRELVVFQGVDII